MEAHNENDARLVVTFFVKTRLSKSNLLAGAPSSDPFESQYQLCGATFTNLLVSLASPIPLTLLSRVILAPGVFQTIFATSAVFPDPSKLRHQASVTTFEASHGIEAVFDLVYPSSPTLGPARRPVRLAVFDMDSTLINEEVIDELARSIGITAAVSAITSRAMNGEIEFAESLRQRLALLKGVKADVWEGLKASITIAAGASELIDELRGQGVITAVVSGGFAPMAEWLKEQLSLDHAYANHLLVSPPTTAYPYPHLSGELHPEHPIVVPEYKKSVLENLARENGIPMSETLAVGDGSNDLLMLGAASLGIAWRAKERVQREAPQRLNGESMTDLLYLLGLKKHRG